MHTTCTWSEKLLFRSQFGDNEVVMDAKAPLGTGKAASPKQLVLAAICGCTAMDVMMHLRKARAVPTAFSIEAKADVSSGAPAVFTHVELLYKVSGPTSLEALLEAVRESMTLECGVSAMIAKCCPIAYRIELDGSEVGRGMAHFP